MPARALNVESGEIEFIYDTESSDAFICIDCRDEVHVVSEHTRDGTTVRRHFRHNRSADSCSVSGGESDLHKRRKSQAMAEAIARFDCELWDTEVEVGEYRADAAVVFEDPHPKYGKGFAIEYQHKNESKDLYAVCEEYASCEFTALILWDSQFDDRSGLADIDLLGGTVVTPFPTALPDDAHEFAKTDFEKSMATIRTTLASEWESGAPATLPPECVDKIARYLWDRVPWDVLMDPAETPHYIMQTTATPTSMPPTDVTLPPEFVDEVARRIRRDQDWMSIFDPPSWREYFHEVRATAGESPSLSLPINQCIPREQWKSWYLKGVDTTVFDGEHCPICRALVEECETERWESVKTCPNGHFGRQTGYKGTTGLPDG